MKYLLVMVCCALLGAAIVPAVATTGTVPAGTWGGDHVLFEVSRKGAEIEFDCAHGQITKPIPLDARGRFNVPGTFTPEHGGPILRDEKPSVAQARYSGRITGDAMSLTVARGKEKVGSFTLKRGQQPILTKCR